MSSAIGILLFDGVEELDAVGPWEVLSSWTKYHPDDGFSVFTMSDTGDSVLAAKGLRISPHYARHEAPAVDVLIYPGGQGTRSRMRDEAELAWVRQQRDTVGLMTSVCTGALVYGSAGLLAGRPATTHWGSLDTLAGLDPTIEVRSDMRWVDDGDLITSAGVSAGIDMALHLVARFAGSEREQQVRRQIEYYPGYAGAPASSAEYRSA